MRRKYFLVSIALAACCFWAYEKFNESFYESSIHLQTWPKKHYKAEDPDGALKEILKQPFTYLGKGRQFFVFESADGNYVLKFVKCQRIDLPAYLPHASERRAQRAERIESMFTSLELASHPFQHTTAVLYSKLAPQDTIHEKIILIDKLGMEHKITLEEVPFVLQQKAIPVLSCLEELIELHDYEEAKRRIDQVIALFQEDAALCCCDKDSGIILRNNIGFLRDRAIHIDIGTLTRQPVDQKEQKMRLEELIDWLSTRNQELASYLDTKIHNGA